MARLLLAGAGHANLLALRAMHRSGALAGRGNSGGSTDEVVLVSEHAVAPYSGMLPGLIAGHTRPQACLIDLPAFAAACGVRFVQARICGMQEGAVQVAEGAPLPFDVLSLNVGAQPQLPPGSNTATACSVKPIGDFLHWLQQQEDASLRHLAVVGGGAGGCETALALAHRWRARAPAVQLSLVTRALLPHGTAAMRRYLRRLLAQRGVQVHEGVDAGAHDGTHLHLVGQGENRLPCCRAVYATPVAALPWFAHTGLVQDAAGFLKVQRTLQSASHAQIFVSGDAAAHPQPLPKAGVIAVRQGATLAHNLPIAAGWRRGNLKPAATSSVALFILGNGSGDGAVASRNGITVSGRWVWWWKQYLDERFMGKFPTT